MSDFDIAYGEFAGLDGTQEVGEQLFDVLFIRHTQFGIFMNWLAPGGIEGPAFLPSHVERPLRSVEVATDGFPFFRVVGGELAMFPDGGKAFKLETGHLMVRRVRRLLFQGIDRGTLDRTAPGREHFSRSGLVHHPQDLVHPMDAPVTQCAVGIVQKIAETFGMNDRAERSQRRGTAPQVPVETFGWFLIFCGLFLIATVVDEGTDHTDLARFSGSQEITTGDVMRRNASMSSHLHDSTGIACGVDHGPTFEDRVPDRFLDIDVRARFDGGDGDEGMPVIGA